MVKKNLNLQERLVQAWWHQQNIMILRKEREGCEQGIKALEDKLSTLHETIQENQSAIVHYQKQEQEIDREILRLSAIEKRTKEQMAWGKLQDEAMGNAQIKSAQDGIAKLEDDFFALEEKQEKATKAIVLCKQSQKLVQRDRDKKQLEWEEKDAEWQHGEEDHQEKIDQLLSKIPLSLQKHFEKYRFTHRHLVAELNKAFCGSCKTRQPLRIVGDINTTSIVHICGSCRAFCVPSS